MKANTLIPVAITVTAVIAGCALFTADSGTLDWKRVQGGLDPDSLVIDIRELAGKDWRGVLRRKRFQHRRIDDSYVLGQSENFGTGQKVAVLDGRSVLTSSAGQFIELMALRQDKHLVTHNTVTHIGLFTEN